MILSKRHILVTGASGQLAQCIREESIQYQDSSFTFLDKQDLDITNTAEVFKVLESYHPDVIINTAAYTQVDLAEDNRAAAFAINEKGVMNLVQYCLKCKCAFIHISTDYVFDGGSNTPYTESDSTDPSTVYGLSKKAGEQAIVSAGLPTYAIIRTSWLYSSYRSNFVKTMLALSEKHNQISVVDDQKGTPTFASDLAIACIAISEKLEAQHSGIYHYAGEGSVTWYAFAKAIFKHTLKKVDVHPVSSEEYPTKAKRPKNSMLDASKIKNTFQVPVHHWETSLQKMLLNIINTY